MLASQTLVVESSRLTTPSSFQRCASCRTCCSLLLAISVTLQALQAGSSSGDKRYSPFSALFAVMNEHNQVLTYRFVRTKEHAEMRDVLEGLKRRYELNVRARCNFFVTRVPMVFASVCVPACRTGRRRRCATRTTAAKTATCSSPSGHRFRCALTCWLTAHAALLLAFRVIGQKRRLPH